MKCISIYQLPLKKISYIRIEIIHGSHSLYNVLTWVTLFSLHFIPRYHSDKIVTKTMLPMLKLYTNYSFHELFLKCTAL